MPRLQFRLRTIFWVTAVAAALCLLIPLALREYREHERQQRLRAQREQTDKVFDPVNSPTLPLR